MYYPYFRGKQYELITIRECAPLMVAKGFIPIIEPVKEQFSGLKKSLEILLGAGGQAIVIINPQLGDHEGRDGISAFLAENFPNSPLIIRGILASEETSLTQISSLIASIGARERFALIHAGFAQPKEISPLLAGKEDRATNIFIEKYSGKLYRQHFTNLGTNVLIRDGFHRRKNKDHPELEFFSDLHITYPSEGVDRFGDFLIVGDDYSEGGGPAYTIAIHLTFIDGASDNAMFIYHFKSDRQDTPKDPAGKFGEALNKLIAVLASRDNKLFESSSITEFRELHQKGHFPGLGHVKKLSMKHHIETLANFVR